MRPGYPPSTASRTPPPRAPRHPRRPPSPGTAPASRGPLRKGDAGHTPLLSHPGGPSRQEYVTSIATREIIMDARLDFFGSALGAKVLRHVNSAGRAVSESGLPHATQELVKIRASQINGCGFCTDMHTKDAAHAGETAQRLHLVAAWREATVFTEAERAALELTEQGTRVADASGGVTDEAWAEAARHYDEDQLVALVSLIAVINTYNRINVINRQPAGDYRPGQFG
ncbi:alkylhydroperoxidase AhpD family core domain-containing protein [Streptomyces prasinopilosus]|uniref:Alkylhydroperoxidase AhpD family core domain-containing protein n=3 Tax=Streptomyces prasinopilosus TaxID=67344 RepID=A0A1G6TDK5_9ACTN|nr:alkylhydroperoxidase AhpD family core domain-containing protein [Streptomyces prasinopilosus]